MCHRDGAVVVACDRIVRSDVAEYSHVDIGEPIALVAYPGEEQEAALRLARVGSDNVVGFFSVDRAGFVLSEGAGMIALATDRIYMRTGAVMGAATPVDGGGTKAPDTLAAASFMASSTLIFAW